MYAVRGSSPELGRSRPPQTAGSNPKLRDTTSSTGVGERVDPPGPGTRTGTKLAIAGAAAIAVVAGFLVFRGDRKAEEGREVAASPPPVAAPAPTAAPPPPAPPPKVEMATVRLVSNPAGARVTNDADGKLLGTTPLVLERPIGGALKLRVEKDGYASSARQIELDGDHTIDLVLEQKARPKPKKTARPTESSEPAKL
jgi:hypothetical protein